MNSRKPHRNLMAWRKTTDFAVNLYQLTKDFPQEELYALTSQLRRAAVSAPSNIAEGAAGRTRQQFSNFLSNAIGSLNEIDTQVNFPGLTSGAFSECELRSSEKCPFHLSREAG